LIQAGRKAAGSVILDLGQTDVLDKSDLEPEMLVTNQGHKSSI